MTNILACTLLCKRRLFIQGRNPRDEITTRVRLKQTGYCGLNCAPAQPCCSSYPHTCTCSPLRKQGLCAAVKMRLCTGLRRRGLEQPLNPMTGILIRESRRDSGARRPTGKRPHADRGRREQYRCQPRNATNWWPQQKPGGPGGAGGLLPASYRGSTALLPPQFANLHRKHISAILSHQIGDKFFTTALGTWHGGNEPQSPQIV